MLRVSSILSKLEDVKGGINTALLTLSLSDRQELIELCPEIAIVKKRLFRKDKIIKEKSLDALIQDYNNEYKEYMRLNEKYAEKTEQTQETKLTTYEALLSCIYDLCKIGQSIDNITLCDAFHILRNHSKNTVWQSLHDLAGSMQDKIKRMVIKGFIKRSSRDNYIANKKWLQFYAG